MCLQCVCVCAAWQSDWIIKRHYHFLETGIGDIFDTFGPHVSWGEDQMELKETKENTLESWSQSLATHWSSSFLRQIREICKSNFSSCEIRFNHFTYQWCQSKMNRNQRVERVDKESFHARHRLCRAVFMGDCKGQSSPLFISMIILYPPPVVDELVEVKSSFHKTTAKM